MSDSKKQQFIPSNWVILPSINKVTDSTVSKVRDEWKKDIIAYSVSPTEIQVSSGDDMQFCPWCHRPHFKDRQSCNYMFACGLTDTGFYIGYCGRAFCFQCGLKFCGQQYDAQTGQRLPTYRDPHTKDCCIQEVGFVQSEYCPGGHNSHCEKRW